MTFSHKPRLSTINHQLLEMSQTTTTRQASPTPATQATGNTGFQITRTELGWPGKYNNDGSSQEVPRFSLPGATDVVRFARLATTEQDDSARRFRVDYIKPTGAIGFYHPDWAVVQKDEKGELNWIIETKGRVWKGTEVKDEAIEEWCKRVSSRTGQRWTFLRVNQSDFDKDKSTTLGDAAAPRKKTALL